jgi:hypothetical protein
MYKLILIIAFTANGAGVAVEEIEFDDKSACQEALIEILNGYDRSPGRGLTTLHIEGFCVPRADD